MTNIPQDTSFKRFVSSAGQTMQTGFDDFKGKLPSTSEMRSSIVRGGGRIRDGLSSAKGSISRKFESVRGGSFMENAGTKAKAAGKNTGSFCRTNWQRSSGFREGAKKFFNAIGFRSYDNLADFIIRPDKSAGFDNSFDTAVGDLELKGWTTENIYDNTTLFPSMVDWAEENSESVSNEAKAALEILNELKKLDDKKDHKQDCAAVLDKIAESPSIGDDVKAELESLKTEGEKKVEYTPEIKKFIHDNVIAGENGIQGSNVLGSAIQQFHTYVKAWT